MALLLGLGARAGAAFWQTPRWALGAAAEASTGYDSNLFSRAGSDGDGYVLLTPSLSLRRLNSLTHLEFDTSVRSYTFFDRSDLDSLDPSLSLQVRYPSDEEVLATEEFEAHLSRRTESNADVGGRLRRDDFSARWEGSLKPTGKLTLVPRASFSRTDYLTRGFNTNDFASAGLTLAFVSNERLQLGAGYDYEWSRSKPDNPAVGLTQGRRHVVTLRGRGEFLPKVTGYAFVGASYNDYSGAVNFTDWDLEANASIAWQATIRGTLTGRANRMTYFSADGSATTFSDLGLEWTQELAGGFFASLGAGGGSAEYRSRFRPRTVDHYGATAELRYSLTERFSASVKAGANVQDSDDPFDDYDHYTFLASATYKF